MNIFARYRSKLFVGELYTNTTNDNDDANDT